MQLVIVFKKVIKGWDECGHFNLDYVLNDTDVPMLNFLIRVIIVWTPLFLEATY